MHCIDTDVAHILCMHLVCTFLNPKSQMFAPQRIQDRDRDTESCEALRAYIICSTAEGISSNIMYQSCHLFVYPQQHSHARPFSTTLSGSSDDGSTTYCSDDEPVSGPIPLRHFARTCSCPPASCRPRPLEALESMWDPCPKQTRQAQLRAGSDVINKMHRVRGR